ncbi:hypothetical protein EDD21DRAFT_391381 [Dissophora ornata]|nr:hypothetical protein EDD21DRAFT_391381 [Dissophora ornata]
MVSSVRAFTSSGVYVCVCVCVCVCGAGADAGCKGGMRATLAEADGFAVQGGNGERCLLQCSAVTCTGNQWGGTSVLCFLECL